MAALTPRTVAIVLGGALALSVAANLFAATAAYTVLTSHGAFERQKDSRDSGNRGPSARRLLADLDPETRQSVRRSLEEANMRARPDFQQARQARRDAVAAAGTEPYDPVRVAALLEQSRLAEARGRLKVEADILAILGTLEPEQRAAVAEVLSARDRKPGRGRGGGGSGQGR